MAILGDRSPSMDVAIKTSTIVACLLTAITDAKLSFFSNVDYVPPELPKTIPQVIIFFFILFMLEIRAGILELLLTLVSD